MRPAGTVLWHIELSHYSEKVRWALDHKGVAYELRAPLPGFHGPVAMALTRSGHRRLPVLRLDGQTIADSTAIVAALEARHPEPALYPSDPDDRARALALEDYFDEQLAPALRAYLWLHQMAGAEGIADAITPTDGRRRRVVRTITPLARPFLRADYGAQEDRSAELRAQLLTAMDRIESELGPSGYLVGDDFSVADLTGAALFTPLLCPPQRPYPPRVSAPELLALREELAAREGGRWVAEMYARHRTARVPAKA